MKKILVLVFAFLECVCLFAQHKIKIPKSSEVIIEKQITVKKNEKDSKQFNEKDYEIINKDNIVVNRLIFKNADDDRVLLHMDNMDVWKYFFNVKKNTVLVRERVHPYKKGKCLEYSGKMFLLDFYNGERTEIDNEIFDFVYSEKDNKTIFIKNYDFLTESNFVLGIYNGKETRYFIVDYSSYLDEGFSMSALYCIKNRIYIGLLQDYFPYVLMLIDTESGKIVKTHNAKYDEKKGICVIEDSEGILLEEKFSE